jgi:hypothetical protein
MDTNTASRLNGRASLLGVLSFVFGVITALSVGMIGVTSFTSFNPPDWLRIATMAPLPLALIAGVGFGVSGLLRRSGRGWAVAGLALVVLAVIAFAMMISAAG